MLTLILTILLMTSCGQVEEPKSAMASVDGADTKNDRGQQGDKGDKGDKGEKGDKGDVGEAGQAGTEGIAGTDGVDGISGTNGASGTNGVNGAAGTNGTNGVDANFLTVVNGAGATLGELYDVNDSTDEFYIANGSMRMQVERANGVFPNAYLVFSGLNCTGTGRMVLTNGKFANTFVDGRNNTTIYKASGSNLGSFNYQSRLAAASNCANTAGSSLLSWVYGAVTLPFAYPIVGAEIVN